MSQKKKNPPKFGERLLKSIFPYYVSDTAPGDFEEVYNHICREKSHERAWLWYWSQILKSIPPFLKNSLYWSIVMLKNYMKIVFRNIKNNKIFSFVNVSGLAIGMACCIVILLFVQDELSYDRFHENSEQIFRVAREFKLPWGLMPSTTTNAWIAPTITNDFPEVMNAVRLYKYGGCIINYGEKRFLEAPFFVDPSFLDVFTFPLVKGVKEKALKDPNSFLITEELAEKIFDDENPLGKTLTIDGKYDFKITGVLENIPYNSHFRFNLIGHFSHVKNDVGEERYNKKNFRVRTYLLLNKTASAEEFEKKIPVFVAKYKGEKHASDYNYSLQPLISIHLHSHTKVELGKNSSLTYSYALSAVAFLILIIACINFMNLSTARATRRSKEVGLRKVIGASRRQLLRQFLGESVFFAFIALLFALLLTELFLPFFNSLMDKQLALNLKENLVLLTGIILLTLFVGFVSGSYPAVFLSSFMPVDVFKSHFKKGPIAGTFLRKGLVLFQFTISIIFIIGTILVFRQVNFIKNRDLGFENDYVIKMHLNKTLRKRYQVFRTELLQNPKISDVTAGLISPGGDPGLPMSYVPEGAKEDEKITLYWSYVDHNFFNFFGVEIVEGRNFSAEITSDIGSALILNERAVKQLGWDSPIGKIIRDDRWGINGRVIGVVKDFHNVSLHEEIKSSFYLFDPQSLFSLYVRISQDNIQQTISFLEKKAREFSPYLPSWHSFLDEDIDNLYRQEKKISKVFGFSSFLTIFIACLGLFGLASFSVERRTKEIGVRKVLGASIPNILILLSKGFTKLVIAANLVAWPIAYFAMNRWLQNFAYRIDIGLLTFILAGILAVFISLVTISYQTVKAAISNPVDTLRYE